MLNLQPRLASLFGQCAIYINDVPLSALRLSQPSHAAGRDHCTPHQLTMLHELRIQTTPAQPTMPLGLVVSIVVRIASEGNWPTEIAAKFLV
jgi:hypothetical protein